MSTYVHILQIGKKIITLYLLLIYSSTMEEKEKNITILTMYHGALLVTMGDYLQNDMLL